MTTESVREETGFGGGVAWAARPDILAGAMDQAFPFAGLARDETADERAWSARVQAAVDGFDVLAPDQVDVWAQIHAESS